MTPNSVIDYEARGRARNLAIDTLADRIAEQAAHLDAATHRLLADIREFDQQGWYSIQGARTCAQWLSWRVGWDRATAREHVRVANKLGELPLIDEALRIGKMSYSKVRAMTRVATPANEAMLLEQAEYSTGAQLEQICRKYASVVRHDDNTTKNDDRQRRYVHQRELADGMVRIEAVLHAEEAALVWAMIEREATARCRERLAAEAAAKRECESASASPDDACAKSSRAPTGCGAVSIECEHAPRTTAEQVFAEADALATGSVAGSMAIASAGALVANDFDQIADLADEPSGDTDDDDSDATEFHREATAQREALAAKVRANTPQWSERGPAFDRADALIALAQDILRGSRKERSPIEVVMTITADTLRKPANGGTVDTPDPTDVGCFTDGNCVSPEAARRVACDCGVVEVVEDERGVALAVGRRKRTIPGAMKRALLRRDKTCRFPGCTARVFLEGHHLRHWADGGATDTDNMACLCGYHHRFVHEYGYTITSRGRGDLEFRTRKGVLVPANPPPARAPDLGLPAIHDQNRALAITAATPACGWDGCQIDYALCVDSLLIADERAERAARLAEAAALAADDLA